VYSDRSSPVIGRRDNEDRWRCVDDALWMVADGIGGRPGGALAAEVAVDATATFGRRMDEASAPELADRVNRIVAQVAEAQGYARAGTTLVVMAAHANRVVALGIGDSRVYRCRAGDLEQLTRDHTVRAELAAAGATAGQAGRSGLDLEALTSYLGRRSDFRVTSHSSSYSIMDGDRFLLCTDGVHGQLGRGEIAEALQRPTCADAADGLLERALAAGGTDNATAVVVEFSSASRSVS
jgi:serine/threonine protein phosphatase PrpC